MKLKKLLKHMVDLQQVTIYDIKTNEDYFTNEIVSEITNLHFDGFLSNMKVNEIYTPCEYIDVIFIGVEREV